MNPPDSTPSVHGGEQTPPTRIEDTPWTKPDAVRAALVGLILSDYDGEWSKPTQQHAEQMADRILRAGFDRERGFWGCDCPSCLASIGDCPRCGQRDKIADLGLCAPCDIVVEAEAEAVGRGSVSGGGNTGEEKP